jgi:uncharacterized protein
MDSILSRYHVSTPPFLDHQDGLCKRVAFATRTAEWRGIDVDTWARIEAGDVLSLPAAVLQDLLDIKLLVPADEDEVAAVLEGIHAAKNSGKFGISVQPTALCQLDCDYCGQAHEAQDLSAENQDRLIHRMRGILAADSYRILNVAWYGAEPLLGLNVIRALAPRFRALAEEFHCEYRSHAITNGWELCDAVATELVKDLGVTGYLVTLDGPADMHDARRPTRGGGGSFARVFANVVALARRKDLEAGVVIRCNVDRRNVEGVSRLIQALADAQALEQILNITFYPVYNWGNDAGSRALPREEFAEREIGWLAELATRGLISPTLIPGRGAMRCLAVPPHSFLVDPFGRLFNCSEASLVPGPPRRPVAASDSPGATDVDRQSPIVSTSATYCIGDLASGEQPGRRQLLGDFEARVARGEYPCSTCRMLPVCGGECPKKWLEGGVPCPSTKYNIEARLLLGYALSRLGKDLPLALKEGARKLDATGLR